MGPQIQERFPDSDYVFAHDGSSGHKAKSVITLLVANNVQMMQCITNSTNLNPIENSKIMGSGRIGNNKCF